MTATGKHTQEPWEVVGATRIAQYNDLRDQRDELAATLRVALCDAEAALAKLAP